MAEYSTAIVGAGLGGLAAAALLSKMNKRVVLLDPASAAGGALSVREREGFRFSIGPVLAFGFDRNGALGRLASSLGIAHSASVLSPCYQVALPDRRISIFIDSQETLEELRREFPREIDGIVRFYRDLRRTSERMARSRLFSAYYQGRSADGYLGSYGFSPEFSVFLDIQARRFFSLPVRALSVASLISLLDSAPLALHGGLTAFAGQMLDVFLRNGGEARYRTPWPRIASVQKRSVVLQVQDGTVDAEAVLFNTRQTPEGSDLFLGVREELLPVGMSREVLCLPDYSNPDRYFTLSVSGPSDETSAPKGMRALVGSFPTISPGAGTKERCLDHISSLIPFLREQMLFADERPLQNREYVFSRETAFRPFRSQGKPLLLQKAGGSLYLLPDAGGAPADTARAATAFAARVE